MDIKLKALAVVFAFTNVIFKNDVRVAVVADGSLPIGRIDRDTEASLRRSAEDKIT